MPKMMRLLSFLLPLCIPLLLHGQSIELTTPIQGVEGIDYFIVNYVDHENGPDGIADYQCGTKTYDGHQGTDFTLRSFAQMDSGVSILAAADGVVFQVIDTLFDRNKESLPERGFGNMIGVLHDGGWLTYYAHLKKGSALVQPGDRVRAGEKIARVGSSGNSTDPHLHFEVWKIDTLLHDPFGPGPCGLRETTLWKDQPTYDTEYRVIDYGLLDFVPTLDSLRERPPLSSSFAPPDTAVTFWIHQQGLRTGDVIRIEWRRTVDDALRFEYEFPASERDWWYHYFWSWISLPPSDEYLVRYFINDRRIVERRFEVEGSNAVDEGEPTTGISVRYLSGTWNVISISVGENSTGRPVQVTLFETSGRQVGVLHDGIIGRDRLLLDLAPLHLSTGTYILQIFDDGRSSAVPIIVAP